MSREKSTIERRGATAHGTLLKIVKAVVDADGSPLKGLPQM